MKDYCNRTIDYLRLSVTDRCNLRCVYCMPEAGVKFTPHERIISYEEILRICRLMVSLGLRKIKITGGEPLVRSGIPWLVKELKAIEGIESVTMTTNGVLLKQYAGELAAAGLDAVNVSLDTLDPEQFQQLTRFAALSRVQEGIAEALKYPEQLSVKLNCVPLKDGEAGNQVLNLVALARKHPLHVRFIELMPIGLGQALSGWSEDELKLVIESHYGALTPYQKVLGNGPCVYYSLAGFQGKVGFISALSHKFCHKCNRIRITSEGFLKTCLQYGDGVDLKQPMAAGISNQELLQLMAKSIYNKPMAHQFGEERGKIGLEHNIMSQIGG